MCIRDRFISKQKKRDPEVHASLSGKNVPKNFGKQIVIFAQSALCKPQVEKYFDNDKEKVANFQTYLDQIKDKITSIPTLRDQWIVPENTSNLLMKENKKLFRSLSYIFLEFYAIRWIYNSKVSQKQAHIQHLKTLKNAIQNPEEFTCLKQ
eukprot:TRINITY_DN2935_c0_g1_i1.p1 TRINITY_DN2935_c0_g1~~TRINITY_DN2935_c0_g1_i1.p1  ORF type:complete len:172 (+),score=1.74 TRINITY_DN2935_c0_g1_i1:66-518(+)